MRTVLLISSMLSSNWSSAITLMQTGTIFSTFLAAPTSSDNFTKREVAEICEPMPTALYVRPALRLAFESYIKAVRTTMLRRLPYAAVIRYKSVFCVRPLLAIIGTENRDARERAVRAAGTVKRAVVCFPWRRQAGIATASSKTRASERCGSTSNAAHRRTAAWTGANMELGADGERSRAFECSDETASRAAKSDAVEPQQTRRSDDSSDNNVTYPGMHLRACLEL